ncbi:protein kinase [Desulfococcaceae bacterium HSG7]|nr:protein kinase [Desulfococcaceae bacterium HSG7]
MNNSIHQAIQASYDQWEQLFFSLEKRDKQTLILISFDCEETKNAVYEKLAKELFQYRFYDLDLGVKPILSIQRTFTENLPEAVLNSNRAEYIVNVFGLEKSILNSSENSKLTDSDLFAVLNFERETIFREFPFITILWADAAMTRKLKNDAQDLLDWVNYEFSFRNDNKKPVKPPEPAKHSTRTTEISPEIEKRIQELNDKYEQLERDDSGKERSIRKKINLQKNLGQEYFRVNDYAKAIQSLNKALELGQLIKALPYEQAEIWFRLGEAYFQSVQYDSAFKQYNKCMDIRKENQINQIGLVYERIGSVFERQGHWNDALTNYKNALDSHTKLRNENEIGRTYQQIGQLWELQRQYGKALSNFKTAQMWYLKTQNNVATNKIQSQIEMVNQKKRLMNPYYHRGLLPYHSDMFLGRQEEMKRIEALLNAETPQCVSIEGERKIGKSSLAFRVFNNLRESVNVVAVFWDCSELSASCSSSEVFFQELNRKFQVFLQKTPENKQQLKVYGDDFFDSYFTFKHFINKESLNGLRFLIFFDEFEHLFVQAFADEAFFSNLRLIATNADNRLAFVTVTNQNLKTLMHSSSKTSEFWDIFTPIIVGLLARKNIGKLRNYWFEKNDFLIDHAESELIENYTGAFPLLNQIVCWYLFDAKKNKNKLDRDSLEIELLSYYENLWESRTEDEKKELQNVMAGSTEDNWLLQTMTKRGLLFSKNNEYSAFCDFFGNFIHSSSSPAEKNPKQSDEIRSSENKKVEKNSILIFNKSTIMHFILMLCAIIPFSFLIYYTKWSMVFNYFSEIEILGIVQLLAEFCSFSFSELYILMIFMCSITLIIIKVKITYKNKDDQKDGQMIGHYRIKTEFSDNGVIARGGMSELLLAERKSGQFVKWVVIKRILPALLVNSDEYVKLFGREAQLAVQLDDHPNIVKTLDYLKEHHAIVMEYIQGKDLADIFRMLACPLTVEQTVFIVLQVANGLQYAHTKSDRTTGQPLNIIHQDIKPSNILVSYEGQVKISDFGIASAMADPESTIAVGGIKGSLPYMSPEQMHDEYVNNQSDIYSLGLVFYEMLIGKKVRGFAGDTTIMRAMMVITESTIDPITMLRPDLPDELNEIVMKCLAKEKKDRYFSTRELIKDMTRLKKQFNITYDTSDMADFMRKHFQQDEMKDLDKTTLDASTVV